MDNLRAIGQPSPLSCPECGGTLFAIDGTPQKRYRCHTGHAFSLRSLQQAQSEATEEALWSGVRALQEKDALLRRVAEIDRLAGDEARANQTELEAHRAADHAAALRVLLEEEPPPTPLTEAATTPRDDEPRSS
jgi:two-component system chemotaxis response regulator CheB